MLIEFRVQNHRSLREEQVLNLEATVRQAERAPSPNLVRAAALYGANASGKSNVLAALAFMKSAIIDSHRFWEPDEGVPRDPFAWGRSATDASLFEVVFVGAGARYQYGFVADDERFLEEWLYAWPKTRKQVWFERDEQVFKFGEQLRGENRLVEEVTRPNALFLSTAAQHHHKQLMPVFRWFRRLSMVNVNQSRRGGAFGPPFEFMLRNVLGDRPSSSVSQGDSRQISLFDEEDRPKSPRAQAIQQVQMLKDLLKAADIGIEDLKLEETEEGPRRRRRSGVLVKHRCSEPEAWLPLEEESNGTRTLLGMAFPLLSVLRDGGVLVIDELERSLHPLLAGYILRQFESPTSNPLNAQLIFTTHDTNLLGTTMGAPALRRDQIWLTEKDAEGASCLYPLSDYKPRKQENLERGYLQGRYGAIPFIDGPIVGENVRDGLE